MFIFVGSTSTQFLAQRPLLLQRSRAQSSKKASSLLIYGPTLSTCAFSYSHLSLLSARSSWPHKMSSLTPKSAATPRLLIRSSCKSKIHYMKTSSNGNIFRVTGHLCGEFTGPRWIPHTKASDAELWCFFFICDRINGWVNNGDAGDLRHNRAHYDVTLMTVSFQCGTLYTNHHFEIILQPQYKKLFSWQNGFGWCIRDWY